MLDLHAIWIGCNSPPWGIGWGRGGDWGTLNGRCSRRQGLMLLHIRTGWFQLQVCPVVRYTLIYVNKGLCFLFLVDHGNSADRICSDISIWIPNQWLHHSCCCSCFGFPTQIYFPADCPIICWSIFIFQSKYSFSLKNTKICEIHYRVSGRTPL